jgi:zinc transport system permease protein
MSASVLLGALDLPWPFEREYMQLALATGLVVGACAPLLGVFLVQKRMSLMGDGIGHLAFAGVAAGLLLEVWPIWTALIVAVAGALAIEWLRARGRATGDLALALFFYGGIALGVVLVSRTDGGSLNIAPYLFGSILTVNPDDARVIAVLGAAILLTLAVFGRALFAVVVDEEAARVSGIPVGTTNAVLSVMTAVTVVAAMRVVGVLLIAALMVLPVATGRMIARSFRATVWWSVGIGVASVVLGLTAARHWDLAPGGSIVLVAAAIFAIVAPIGRLRRGAPMPHVTRFEPAPPEGPAPPHH